MMASLNKVMLIGRLGADPEIKSFQNGGKVANFRLACSESWKDKASGERKEKTEWVSVAVFNDGLVGVVERFLKKGSQCFVEGKLQTRKWQDQSGNDRYTTEVVLQGFGGSLVLLDGKQGGDTQRAPDGSRGAPSTSGDHGRLADDLDDDVPFVTCAGVW